MRTTIRTQLLIINTLALIILFGSMSAYLVISSTHTLRTRLKDEVRSFTTLATAPIGDSYSVYGSSGTGKVHEIIRSYIQDNATITNVAIVDLSGSTLYNYDERQAKATVSSEQAGTFTPIYITDSGNLTQAIIPYFGAAGSHSYSIVYTISSDAINNAIRQEAISLLAFSLLSLIITSAVTFAAISYFILRPLKKVSDQAAIISSGNLEQQIEAKGSNEIAQLAQAVNAMAESLKASITKLQEIDKVKSEFMAITSHNLRTPLTIINSYLESIAQYNTVEELKKAFGRIAESVKRLDDFAEDVITISRYELGEGKDNRETVAVRELVENIVAEVSPTAEMHELQFSYTITTDAVVRIGKPYLRSAILNILDNAIKFTPKGGQVDLAVTQQNASVSISVTDTGIGIDPEEVPKLFTKFHRGTSVTTYDYEGTGIGLYASKIIIEAAGGTITVDTKKDSGSTFTITLPVAS